MTAFLPPLIAEALDHCEECGRALHTGDMAFTYDDGPTFCWEHSPTWDDLKIAHAEMDEMGEPPTDEERQRVLDRIANGEGDKHVASIL